MCCGYSLGYISVGILLLCLGLGGSELLHESLEGSLSLLISFCVGSSTVELSLLSGGIGDEFGDFSADGVAFGGEIVFLLDDGAVGICGLNVAAESLDSGADAFACELILYIGIFLGDFSKSGGEGLVEAVDLGDNTIVGGSAVDHCNAEVRSVD